MSYWENLEKENAGSKKQPSLFEGLKVLLVTIGMIIITVILAVVLYLLVYGVK
jgi:hypothetical protein